MNNWKKYKLSFLVNRLTNGYVGQTKNLYQAVGIPYLLARHVKSNKLTFDKKTYVTKDFNNKNKKSILKKGDVLLGQCGHIGHSAVVTKEHEGHNCHAMIVITPKPELLTGDFLSLYFNSPYMQESFDQLKTGSTIKHLNCKVVKEIDIPLPPLKEQKRIVSILDEAFAAIDKAKENAEKNLANARELFELQLENYYSDEGDWPLKHLSEIAEYFNGLTYSPKDVSEKGTIVLRSSNVQDDRLDFEDIIRVNLKVKEKIIVCDGDILMCSRNGSKRLVGKTARISNLSEEMTFGTFMMIIRGANNDYLSWFFKSKNFKKQIAGGENTMIGQITRYMLDEVVVPFPPEAIQKKIFNKLNTLFKEVRSLENIYQKKLLLAEELRKSISQKAFTGELTSKQVAELV